MNLNEKENFSNSIWSTEKRKLASLNNSTSSLNRAAFGPSPPTPIPIIGNPISNENSRFPNYPIRSLFPGNMHYLKH